MRIVLALLVLVALACLIVGIQLMTRRGKQRRNERPYEVQAAEVAASFAGQPQVTYYPTYTALSPEQITQVAASRGYRLSDQGSTYKGHPYMKFQRMR